jgi:adenine-specific DNA-methyltransferase
MPMAVSMFFGIASPEGAKQSPHSQGTAASGKERPPRGDMQSSNIFIEGDNLEALKLLYKPYFGRIKMIYIDPPYNTGNDFIYPDDYSDPLGRYLELTGQQDAAGNLLTSNPETSGRYHSAWLSMMYPRLFLARQLLREDGVIFVSIDDHEVHNLRMLMNEIFGEENFVESYVWKKSYGGGAKEKYAVTQHEYILMYSKSIEALHELWLPPDENAEKKYYKYEDERGPYRIKPLEATKSMDSRPNLVFPIPTPWGTEVWPKRQWWWGKERVMQALEVDGLVFTKNDEDVSVSYKQYLYDEEGEKRGAKPFSIIEGVYTQRGTADLREVFGGDLVMQFPKPVDLIKFVINTGLGDDKEGIVLDFFAGSATTAEAMFELNQGDNGNRRFILVQLPEPIDNSELPTIAEIGKERIRRVVARMKKERAGQLPLDTRATPEDLGFRVYKLASSHFKPWAGVDEKEAAAYTRQMELFRDPLVEGWTAEGVLTELALKHGFSLSMRFEALPGPKGLYRVSDPEREQSFTVSLADRVTLDDLSALELGKDDLFLCRDAALDDETAANLALQCRLETI